MVFTVDVSTEPAMHTIELGDLQLRAAQWGTGAPTLVMLHDGLGSIPQWRTVPGEVAERTGHTVLAYERAGHGASLPVPDGPWPSDWLHREAEVLVAVAKAVGADQPVIVGHSDGGSIALLYAAQHNNVARVLALAAHSWVEQVCFDAIVSMRATPDKIIDGLRRSHDEPEAIFEAWSGVWVSEQFRTWDVRPMLDTIAVPTLIAQGALDDYATEAHAHLTAAAIGRNAESLIVPDVGHIMHHDDADVVAGLIADFAGQRTLLS